WKKPPSPQTRGAKRFRGVSRDQRSSTFLGDRRSASIYQGRDRPAYGRWYSRGDRFSAFGRGKDEGCCEFHGLGRVERAGRGVECYGFAKFVSEQYCCLR